MSTEAPVHGRGRVIGQGLSWTARWSVRLLLTAAGATLIGLLIGQLWSIVFPVLMALLVATVLWPPAAWLRRHKVPPALASAIVLLLGLGVVAGLITIVGTSVSGSVGQIAASVSAGIEAIGDWLTGPPLNLGQSQLDTVVQTGIDRVQSSISAIATNVLATVGSFASGLVTTVLTLVLAFLFVKDGPKFLPWVRKVAGAGAGGHVSEVMRRIWTTISEFIRTQAVVAFVDALFIGIGLLIVGVPLALPLAVITFLGGFIPIVGAVVAGALAVLVALVSNGFTAAVIVLLIVLAVQQIEGNVLQPILQSRSLGLHAAVVLLAVTAGSTLYGIAGAFLSVPVTAAAAVVLRYLGELIDQRTGAQPSLTDVDDDGRPENGNGSGDGDESGEDTTPERDEAPSGPPAAAQPD
ncbi:MAG: AI-2E family transporter [Pseudonocardia sediminis]